jgi:splicing factor U2AF subunit
MVTNIPLGITEEQIHELVSTFGEVKAFNLIKTANTSQSAVLDYADKKVTDDAIAGLNKLEIADYRLAVQRVPAESAAILLQPLTSRPSAGNLPSKDPLDNYPPSRILRLSNMTVEEDLMDDELYSELKEDILEECSKYGELLSIEIPRLARYGGSLIMEAAVGYIFLQYASVQGAEAAQKAVAGRSFNGKIVKTCFYPEDLYTKKVSIMQ